MNYTEIEEWYEPRKILDGIEGKSCGMSEKDHGFLCGLIKKKRPKKIVEIGIAYGGTTGVILKSAEILGLDVKLYSIDLSEQLFVDSTKKTGFIYDEILRTKLSNSGNQITYLGKTIADLINEIGGNIDMAIIDTTHELPGEIMDFLVLLPFMASKGTIVLHDVGLNYHRVIGSASSIHVINSGAAICTKVLFNSVKSDVKYLNIIDNYPNIGAFEIDENLRESIVDIFNSLTMTWSYMPDDVIIESYRKVFEKNYDSESLRIFDFAVSSNKKMRQVVADKSRKWQECHKFINYVRKMDLPVSLVGFDYEEEKLVKEFLKKSNIDFVASCDEQQSTDNIIVCMKSMLVGQQESNPYVYMLDNECIAGIKGWIFDKNHNFV